MLMGLFGFAVPAAALVAVTNSTLQAFGRIDLPLVSMFAGAVVKMLGDYFSHRQSGAEYHGCAHHYGALLLADRGHQPVPHQTSDGFAAADRKNGLPSADGHHRHECGDFHCAARAERCVERSPGTMPDKLITLACIGVAVAVYAVLLLALGAVERDDVLLLPAGEKIRRYFTSKVIRKCKNG